MLLQAAAFLGAALLLVALLVGHYHLTRRVWGPQFEAETDVEAEAPRDDRAKEDSPEDERWQLDDGWL